MSFVTACVGIHFFLLTGDRKIYSTLRYLVNVCYNKGRINPLIPFQFVLRPLNEALSTAFSLGFPRNASNACDLYLQATVDSNLSHRAQSPFLAPTAPKPKASGDRPLVRIMTTLTRNIAHIRPGKCDYEKLVGRKL
ncbi:hypothetical protein DPMN_191326 [Dreissena polymorpha]|uniref:Uncharacterized protein n=1 Tax=Dreissena polymorpha TaxID=45954 RepID=A0A9D4BEA5_DREPO|nr:hypothetical protein DPMN_191326 [Dreissena polymorpha]